MSSSRILARCGLALALCLTLLSLWGLTLQAQRPAADAGWQRPPPPPNPFAWSPDPLPDYPAPPLAAPRPAAALPADLSIFYISRTPHYQRYCVDYDQDVPELCAGAEHLQRFPAPAEPVTFTARVANQGDLASAAAAYTWTLDGVVQAVGMLPALAPGTEIDLEWGWAWQEGAHIVTLALAAGGEEVTLANNRLEHRTDAHYLEVLVHPYFVQAFQERLNLAGSYSFQDWLQAQFEQMNQRLAAAVFPDTPDGLADRIRIDVITPTVEVGGDIVSGALNYDGRWTFRTARDYRDTPEDEAWESAQNYARQYAAGIDWGLIHELTHQLGIIDLYQLNVSPSAGNLVRDGQGLPLLIGFQWTRPGLMGGDDASPYDGAHYSEHTAMGLATNTGYRRGYFGEYLFDLPEQIRLLVLDNRDQPLAGATVEIYQSEYNVVQAAPVATGKTGADGVFVLPDRPVPFTLTTATGHTLRPNPFGRIDVVGRNGQLLLRVTKDGQEAYRWLPLTDMNKAAWRGQQVVTLTLQTPVPSPALSASHAAALLPPDLQVRTQGNLARLQWQPVEGASSYNVYYGVWPEYYPFQPLAAGLSGNSYEATLTRTTRFAVTSVGADGAESGFSQAARAEWLFAPTALVWEPSSPWSQRGQLLAVDGHSGALLRLLPPEADAPMRWIGRMGSEHHGAVGAVAATLGPGDALGVALGGQRVWVFDSGLQPLNWFGRSGEQPSMLDRPAGMALAGPPFTVDVALARPDADAILLLPFDGSLLDPGGLAPLLAENVTFSPGRHGQAVHMAPGARLLYTAGDFPVEGGAVEFWLRPTWPGVSKDPHVLFEVGDPGRTEDETEPGFRLRLAQQDGGLYVWVTNFDDFDKAAWAQVVDWQAGEWHHVAATWDAQRLNLHIDGRLAWGESLRVPISGTAVALAVGSTLAGKASAGASFENLRVSRFPRLGNSAAARVLVSEALLAEVGVFDLLGNPISVYRPELGHLSTLVQPGALAVGPGDTVWLADPGAGRVHRLVWSGDTLVWQAALAGFPPQNPRALAVNTDGLLAAAVGDTVLLIDAKRWPTPVASWTAPNDGSPGPFRWPAALAFGPDGDLAIAERDNRRISFIHQPQLGRVHYLPLLWRG